MKWYDKIVASLILTVFMIGIRPAQAALSEGKFIPLVSDYITAAITEKTYYYVKKGDTLWDISAKYQVDLDSLFLLNDLNYDSKLNIGEKIIIPGATADSVYHEIVKGDTLWSVSRKYGVPLTELRKANPGVEANNIKPGAKIFIPLGSAEKNAVTVKRTEPSRGHVKELLLAWPLAGKITSPFGPRRSGFHHGIDIAGKTGDSIQAAAEGEVSFAGSRDIYGNMVRIVHSDGSETLYGHLSKILVKTGQHVGQGERIGAVGATGNATGPHLHFEIRKGTEYLDPVKLIR
ncbi:MAG: M23 family metallopeptidase [Syntrophomonadaceae bacterium]|jgi:murein DD-endopeptidase MepM/ murein hydrolase activator NlpD|nr:M23 family metallopeptidase [Syntrophomonadaceae bacterium]